MNSADTMLRYGLSRDLTVDQLVEAARSGSMYLEHFRSELRRRVLDREITPAEAEQKWTLVRS